MNKWTKIKAKNTIARTKNNTAVSATPNSCVGMFNARRTIAVTSKTDAANPSKKA
jgi:hypothetical protein